MSEQQTSEACEDGPGQAAGYLRSLIEASLDPMATVDLDGRITDANAASAQARGLTRSEEIGNDFATDFTEPERVRAALAEALQSGSVRDLTLELRHRDGHATPVLYNLSVYHDVGGAPLGVLAVGRDISALRIAEADLAATRQRLDLHVLQTPLGVVDWTPDGLVHGWNPAAERIFGWTREEALGQHWTFIVPQAIVGDVVGVWEALCEQRGGTRSTNDNVTKDGRLIHCDWFSTTLVDSAGAVVGVASLVLDETERVESERELESHRAHLAELVAERSAELAQSEARLVQAQTVARVGNWEWDAVNDQITASKEFYRLFGVAPSQIRRFEQFVALVHEDDRPKVRQAVEEAISQRRPYDTEYRVRLADGSWRHLNARGETEVDDQGRPLRMRGTCLDITDRVRVEQALREREAYYRTLVQSLPHGIFVKDRQGIYLSASESYAGDFGLRPEDFVGKDDYAFHPRELADKYRADDADVLQSRQAKQLDEPYVVDGEERWIHTVKTPVWNDAGEIVALLGIFEDITERRNAAMLVEERALQYSAILATTSDGFWLTTANGEFLDVNDAYCQMTGYSRDELLGMAIPDVEIGESAAETARHIESVMARGFDRFETRHRRKDGSELEVEVSATYLPRRQEFLVFCRDITERRSAEAEAEQHRLRLEAVMDAMDALAYVADMDTYELLYLNRFGREAFPGFAPGQRCFETLQVGQTQPCAFCTNTHLVDTDGQPKGVHRWEFQNTRTGAWFDCRDQAIRWTDGRLVRLEVATDITDRKEAERSIAERSAELARSNQELEQFAYVASHDLQEPLRMVSSYTQLLEERYSQQLDQDAREFIGYAVDGASRMQRLIEDLLTYSRITTRGRDLVQVGTHGALAEAISNLGAAIAETHALVTTDELPPVRADRSQMVQLFQNLIGNGIKFHRPEHAPQVHISAATDEDDPAFARFAVRDNGIGIEARHVDRLFVIFSRLHTRRKYAGTGIGLALCKRIVTRHGGRIWLESEPNQGTTFYFTLPVADGAPVVTAPGRAS